MPDDLLGTSPQIGISASISLPQDGTPAQMDRGGNLCNSRQPADDVANYIGPWSKLLEEGGYPAAEARQAALTMLPDIGQWPVAGRGGSARSR